MEHLKKYNESNFRNLPVKIDLKQLYHDMKDIFIDLEQADNISFALSIYGNELRIRIMTKDGGFFRFNDDIISDVIRAHDYARMNNYYTTFSYNSGNNERFIYNVNDRFRNSDLAWLGNGYNPNVYKISLNFYDKSPSK